MWIMDIPLKVLTRLRVEGMKSLSEYYPNLNITDDDKQLEKPSFPTVFVQDIGGTEQGQDIEGKSVNAVLSTIQIDVVDNEKQSNVREVMSEMIRIMKSMGYSITTTANFERTTDNTYRMVARFRRMIGYNDTFVKQGRNALIFMQRNRR